jgi:predicted dehydrogenase
MEKIKVGVIGAGHWGPNLIRNFHMQKCSSVIKVADSVEDRLALVSDRYPQVETTKSSDDILKDNRIDAVIISTPTATHYELSRKALENGKHVFVEKPLAMKVEECDELVRLAKERGKTLFVGHVFVYNAGIDAAKAYIKKGELGRIHYIHITRTNLGPIRTDVNVLWDLVPHDISILRYWLGENAVSVNATGSKLLSANREDVVFATFRFDSGVRANVHASWLNPKKVREIVVVGEKKMLVWDDMSLDACIKLYDKSAWLVQSKAPFVDSYLGFRASIYDGVTLIPKVEINEPLTVECATFIQAIANPKVSRSTGDDGREVVRALLATQQSMDENGREVPILS